MASRALGGGVAFEVVLLGHDSQPCNARAGRWALTLVNDARLSLVNDVEQARINDAALTVATMSS